jgi:ubiquinone biosynthesis protein UbiJ
MNVMSMPMKSIEQTINRLISDDEDTLSQLNKMSGKCIELLFVNKNFSVYIWPSSIGIELNTAHEGDANVTIKGSLSDMFTYMLASREGSSIQKGNLEVIGDIGLAQDFQNAMKNIDLDWEEYLSAYTGDILAHKIGNIVKAGTGYAAYASTKFKEDISEYLMYEKKVLLSEIEVKEFVCEIDILRDDVERLKLRLDRLSIH